MWPKNIHKSPENLTDKYANFSSMKYLKQATVETFSPPFSDVCSDKLNILCVATLLVMDDRCGKKSRDSNLQTQKHAMTDNLTI